MELRNGMKEFLYSLVELIYDLDMGDIGQNYPVSLSKE